MRQGIGVLILGCLDVFTATYTCAIALDDRTADESVRLQIKSASVVIRLIVLNNAVTYMRISRHNSTTTTAILTVRSVGKTMLEEQTVEHGTLCLSILPCAVGRKLAAFVNHHLFVVEQIVCKRNNVVALAFGTGA